MIETERRKIVIYGENTGFSEAQIQQIGAIVASALSKHLDSFNADVAGMPKGDNDMSKRIKQRAVIDGRERWITGETQQDIFNAYLRQAINAGIVLPAQGAPGKPAASHAFKPYAQQWKARYKDGKRKHTTLSEYESLLTRHLYPYFGSMAIEDITRNTIQDFLNSKSDYARKTIHEMLMVLGMFLECAVEDDIIAKNPARSSLLEIPSTRKKTRTPLTEEQMMDIIANMEKLEREQDRLFVGLLLFTGMRRSEVLGLQWQDIDLRGRVIHIRRGVTYNGNKPVVSTPKTEAGIRTVLIAEPLYQLLQAGGEEEIFLIGATKEPVSQQTVKRMWERISRTINVYGKTPHCFRHSFTTLAWRSGMDEKLLQQIGGWADRRTMQNIYTHVQQEDIQKAGTMVTAMFGGECDTEA